MGCKARKYWTTKRGKVFILSIIDSFLLLFVKPQKKQILNPQKILISNIAHLGDLLVSVPSVMKIHKYFPKCEIHLLVNSECVEAASLIRGVDKVFSFEHYRHNRKNTNILFKVVRHYADFFPLIKKLRKENYTLTIDFYPFFGNSSWILFLSRIPYRVGYSSGGFSSLFHLYSTWKETTDSIKKRHFDLLKSLFPNMDSEEIPVEFKVDHSRVLSSYKLISQEYFLFFPYCGRSNVSWVDDSWVELGKRLQEINQVVVLMGKGKGLEEKAIHISKGLKESLSYINQCPFKDLILLIANAKGIITLDSAPLHLADMFDTPTVVVNTGMVNSCYWVPRKNSISLRADCGHYPCYQKYGCDSLACIKKITPQEVLNAIIELVKM
ncbi:MAG TPA: glycosyltransferase family 9 protein [Chlamydiales bacterium]|nr:glycosyltransferase family 9 protein [Chlamydiales bacterium]